MQSDSRAHDPACPMGHRWPLRDQKRRSERVAESVDVTSQNERERQPHPLRSSPFCRNAIPLRGTTSFLPLQYMCIGVFCPNQPCAICIHTYTARNQSFAATTAHIFRLPGLSPSLLARDPANTCRAESQDDGSCRSAPSRSSSPTMMRGHPADERVQMTAGIAGEHSQPAADVQEPPVAGCAPREQRKRLICVQMGRGEEERGEMDAGALCSSRLFGASCLPTSVSISASLPCVCLSFSLSLCLPLRASVSLSISVSVSLCLFLS
jgi:hypothetical protein